MTRRVSMALRAVLVAALVTCAALMPAGRASAVEQSAAPPRIVARAGRIVVSEGEVLREALMLRRDGRFESVVQTATVDGLDQVSRGILDRKLLSQEARRRGIDQEPGVRELTTRAADLVLVESLVTRIKQAADVSNEALRAFYQQHADRFRTGVRRHARHIVVATEADLHAAQDDLRAGRPFAEVAAARNIDPTKKNGGDLGWISPGTMVADFETTLFGLDVGQVSEPVRTGMGFHLVLVEEIDPGTLPSFDLVKDRVADAIKADAVSTLLASLRQVQPITIDRAALDDMLK